MDEAATDVQRSVEELSPNDRVWSIFVSSIARRHNSNIPRKVANQPIPAVHLWFKLQSLATYSKDTLAVEIQRLALFAPGSLKKELEPKLHAPINRLPDDILSDIFLLGLRDAHTDDKEFETPQRYQGLISLVCRRWRTVIEGTPLAWANITVLDRQPFTTTKRFLRLSGSCLINVAVNWSVVPLDEDGILLNAYNVDEMDYLFGLVLPEAHRWRSLSVAIEDYSLMLYAVQRLQSIAAPNLRVLWLSHHDDDEPEEVVPEMAAKYKLFQTLPGAPLLRDVTLWGVHIDWSSPIFSSNLRKLALCYHHIDIRPGPQRFFDILSSCSETLEEFTLEHSGPVLNAEDWDPYTSSKIELPNLHTLKVAFVAAEYARGVLGVLVARNVKELTLDFEDWENEAEWNTLIRQLCTGGITSKEPMFPALTSLSLLSLPAEPVHLGTLLYYHPKIASLTINFNYVQTDLIDTLGIPIPKILVPPGLLPEWATVLHSQVAQYRDKPITEEQMADESVRCKIWVCPELRKLTVYGIGGEPLRLLVAGRKGGGVPLKEIWYADTCTLKMSDRAWLKANLEVFEEFEDEDDEELDEDDDDEDD